MLKPPRRLLKLGLTVALVAWLYSLYTANQLADSVSVEQAIVFAWNKLATTPQIHFRKIVVGINCNVDLLVSGAALLRKLQVAASEETPKPADSIGSLRDLESTFAYFFSRGAPAERYTSEQSVFDRALIVLENQLRHQTVPSIGGNAALLAQSLSASYMKAKILLVGPIGPRLKALLHPNVITLNSTKISKDELHISMEYKAGEMWGDNVAPVSSRFITSHDVFSGSAISIDIFFNTIAKRKPDLVLLSGVHVFEFQKAKLWMEKLGLIKRNLVLLSPRLPVHLQLGSITDKDFALNVLTQIIPNVDSLALNEQELRFLSSVGGGPNSTTVSGAPHVYKAVDMLHWLISNYGKDKTDVTKSAFRLQRIHFHCLTYQLMVSVGSEWSNLASGLAAGVRVAGRFSCGLQGDGADTAAAGLTELRIADTVLLDREQGRMYELNPHSPVQEWMREDILFIFSPSLVCKNPVRTTGYSDAIAAAGLSFSQFYRYGHTEL